MCARSLWYVHVFACVRCRCVCFAIVFSTRAADKQAKFIYFFHGGVNHYMQSHTHSVGSSCAPHSFRHSNISRRLLLVLVLVLVAAGPTSSNSRHSLIPMLLLLLLLLSLSSVAVAVAASVFVFVHT